MHPALRQSTILATGTAPILRLDFLSGILDSRITFTRGSNATLTDSTGKVTYAPANLLLNTATLSTQSVTTQAISYILSFKGTGSVALSGAYTGSLAGTGATDRVYLKFTSTAASLTLTVTGTVTEAQLEPVTYQTTPSTYQATTSSAYYGPRFDYDPVSLSAKGLLVEEARTNYALYCCNLTNAVWTATNMATAMTATGPDGVSNSATTITASAGNATILQAITDASNARITSCYIKRRTGTGTVEMTQDNGSTWTAVTVTSSWTRVSIASATLANPTIGLRLVTNGDAVDVYGFQNERGAFVTSLIPTVASTVTRSADVATMTGTNFSAWYNQSEGTFVAGATMNGDASDYLWQVDESGAGLGFLEVTRSGLTALNAFSRATGGGNEVSINTTIAQSTPFKHAFAYKLNDFAAVANGGTVGTDVAGTPAPAMTVLYIGKPSAGSSNYLNGHIRYLKYFNVRLPNSQLQSETS